MTEGTCKPGFERVAEAFRQNFDGKGEVGASVCLTVGGETVVDLWGGVADQKTGAPWTTDTVSIVFSCTKGATALCAHILASRGKLDLDAPVVELWPEFGQHGKEHVTTRMMLDHSSAVPALRAPVKESGPFEWDYMTGRLADEVPFWQPGTRNGYHGFTFGWTSARWCGAPPASHSAPSSVKRWRGRSASTSGSACPRRSSRGSRRSRPMSTRQPMR